MLEPPGFCVVDLLGDLVGVLLCAGELVAERDRLGRPAGGGSKQIADYIRLIAVAFPLTSARRSSAYAGQLIADCCGDFPSLAAIPPAFVFGGGPVKRSGPAEACAQTGIDGRERCHWPGGEGPAALTSSPGPARDGTAPAWRRCAVRRVRPGRGPDRECLLERRRLAGSPSQVTRREDSGSLDPNQLLRPHGTRRPCHDRYKPMEPVSPVRM